jgi:DsbC/DsbD-like thiol-disulfide interchange protein
MITGLDRLRRLAAPAARAMSLWAIVLGSGAHVAAAAEHASRWDGDERSTIRLIAGSSQSAASAALRAGIEIKLKAGWHTYWRYPGDAGVPPRFDFAGSSNLKSVDVRWPAPRRVPEQQGLMTIGYTSDLIFPLAVVPQNRGKPVTLRLKLGYAVCENRCVPADGKAELVLAAGPSPLEGALAAAEARVPKQRALGAGASLAIRAVRREDGPTRPRVIVDVAAPGGADVDLFAEGPTPDWALPVPTAVDGAPAGLRRFAFDLDGAPPGAKYEGILITLTAVAGEEAIEVTTRLD